MRLNIAQKSLSGFIALFALVQTAQAYCNVRLYKGANCWGDTWAEEWYRPQGYQWNIDETWNVGSIGYDCTDGDYFYALNAPENPHSVWYLSPNSYNCGGWSCCGHPYEYEYFPAGYITIGPWW